MTTLHPHHRRLGARALAAPHLPALLLAECLALVLSVGCNGPEELGSPLSSSATEGPADSAIVRLMPTTKPGSMAPNIALTRSGPVLSWLEPDQPGSKHFSLRVSRLQNDRWSSAHTVVEGNDFFANWADFPSVAETSEGDLLAHWLRKIDTGTYAYGVGLAGSSDGEAWTQRGWLHNDLSPTEHGFVSFAPNRDHLVAFWLDGREMENGGAMSLRARSLDDQEQPSTVLDDRVCECCQTDAAITDEGPIVVYRNRSEQEIRDPWRVRWTGAEWSEPQPIHQDGWRIAGCPVNGPSVAAFENRVAVAWFTAADNQPRIKLAFSEDSGNSFGQPILIDDKNPVGRVDVVIDETGTAWVSWLGRTLEGAGVLLTHVGPSGRFSEPPLRVAGASAERASGFPRMVYDQGRLLLAWTETADSTRIAVATVEL